MANVIRLLCKGNGLPMKFHGKRKRRLRQSAMEMADDNQEKFNQETINKRKNSKSVL